MARLHAEGTGARLQILASVSAIGLCACTLQSRDSYIWGQALIGFVFGSQYAEAWLPLMILCGAGLATSTVGIAIAVLHASGNERDVTLSFAASLVTGAICLPVWSRSMEAPELPPRS